MGHGRLTKLAVLAVLVAPRASKAEFVVELPELVEHCNTGKTWDNVVGCVKQRGDLTIVKTTDTTRLIHVVKTEARVTRDFGFYLYVSTKQGWSIGGLYEPGETSEMLAFEPLTIDHHDGYHLRFGRSLATTTALTDGSRAGAVMSQIVEVYCAGDGYRCSDVVSSCDVLVQGKAVRTFRGRVTITDGWIEIGGDRKQAGECAPAARTFLGWHRDP